MNTKLFDRKQHGINDYGFAAIQLLVPALIGCNKNAVRLHALLGANVLAYNALSDTPVGLKPLIPYKIHEKVDIATVAGLALLTFAKPIRQDKRALPFHIGLVALAAVNVLLTDWDD